MNTTDEAFLNSVLDLMLDAVCVVDPQSRFVFVSAACEHIFGYRPEEMVGRPMLDFVHPEDRARTLQAVDEIVTQAPKPHFENRYVRKDGTVVHVMWSARWSEAEQVRVAVARDVTAYRRAEAVRAALYAISEAAHSSDTLPSLFERTHGIVRDRLPASRFVVVLRDAGAEPSVHAYRTEGIDALAAEDLAAVEAFGLRIVGEAGPLREGPAPARESRSGAWLGVPLEGPEGAIGALLVADGERPVYTADDVDLLQYVSVQLATAIERQRAASALQRAARHDPLTDLANRLLLRERLHTALIRAREDGTLVSLLYLDLDEFKQVNDGLGHAVGDLLLQESARRLKACVRDSDTVARIGGDEFVVVLCHLREAEQALVVAEKIRSALCTPFDLGGTEVRITPSIGIASFPEHGDDEDQLSRRADASMYEAKRSGGNRLRAAS